MSTASDDAASATFRRYLSAVVLHAQASAKAAGLGATDLYALNVLELCGPMTPGELGARTGLTSGPTTRLIDRLVDGRYVRRVPDSDDRRKVVVEPIDRPADLNAVLAPARRRVGAIIADYPAEHRAVLFDYFARAAEAFERATEELP